MNLKQIILGSLLFTLLLVPGQGTAFADLRDYIVNRQYYTPSRGEFEIELYNDLNLAEADNDDSYNSKHQIELEYGLTNRWMVAYYEVFTWDRAQDWKRDAYKIETKYRFAESGQWPVDVALYSEYKNPNGSRDARSDSLEAKLILAKHFGPWHWIGNWIVERKLNEGDFWEQRYTLGVSYAVTPRTRLALEIKETLGDTDNFGIHRKDHKFQLIPGIYTSPRDNMRILFGPAIGLTRATDDLQLKSIVEIEF